MLTLVIIQQIYSNCLRKCCILNIHCHCLLVTSVQRSGNCLKTFSSINSTSLCTFYLFIYFKALLKIPILSLEPLLNFFLIYSGLLKTFHQSNTERVWLSCLRIKKGRMQSLDFRGHSKPPILIFFFMEKARY